MAGLLFFGYYGILFFFEAVIVYLAFQISLIVGRAPRGWYLIIAGTLFFVVRTSIIFVASWIGNTTSVITYLEDILSVIFAVLVASGLYYLRRDFERSMKSMDWKALTRTAE